MPDNHLFEYAVVRVVPRVEREEFLNVGVVLFCKRERFLKFLYQLDSERLLSLAPKADLEEIESHLRAFELISEGREEGGPIARLDEPSRFRWLTATRSTMVQASKVHPGLCTDPGKALQRLFEQLVL